MAVSRTNYNDAKDEELVKRIAGRDADAFNELYHRYGQKLFGYFYKMLWKNKELAEDKVQELFINILKHAGSFDEQRSFSTWVYSIASNMCKNEYRAAAVKAKHTIEMETTTTATEREADLQRFRLAVNNCINELAEDKRSLFILRFNEQLTVPQISEVLGVPEGTVKSRLFYLLKEMKTSLGAFKTLHLYP
jgi:RNA polymerase sigma-70 factor, ECF subfamily